MKAAESPRLLTHEFWPFRGGVASFCRDLAGGLVAIGERPTVHAPELGRGLEEGRFSFEVERYRGPGRLTPAGIWAARQAWVDVLGRDDRPVVLGSYGAITGAALGPCPPKGRVVGVILHGSEVLKWRGNCWLGWRVRRWLRGCRVIFCNSEFTRSGLLAFWPESAAGEVRVLRLGPGSTALGEVKPREADPLGRVRILVLARVHPRKGQVELIRACGMLGEEERRGVVVQVAGTGRREDLVAVELAATAHGVAVEFLGEVSDEALPSVYAQSDVYALTPVTLGRSVEGFGMTFLEAGAHGKAVIGYRSGGVTEAVVDGETGLLVEEGDLEGLAGVIRRVVRDRGLRERLGEGGRRRALERSWVGVAAEVRAGLLGGGGMVCD